MNEPPDVRETLTTMTPDELRARMPPATMRKLRLYQGLMVFLAVVLLACGVVVAGEFVVVARAALLSPRAPAPDAVTTRLFVAIGGAALATAGLNGCRVRLTELISDALRQSLKKDATGS